MRGEHSDHQQPIMIDQLTSDDIVKDYDEYWSPKYICNCFKKYLGGCECKKESVLEPDTSVKKSAESKVIYYVPACNKSILLLAKNISYLGKPHPSFKKRIQIPSKWRTFVNNHNDTEVHFIGVYHYKDLVVFVDFDKSNYLTSRSTNSSAHVMVNDLFLGYREGVFSKIDYFGNKITTINCAEFRDYLMGNKSNKPPLLNIIEEINAKMPFNVGITGVEAYRAMRAMNFKYCKETEWCGFYTEFLFDKATHELHYENRVDYRQRKKDVDGIELDFFFTEESFFGDIKSSNEKETILYGNKVESIDTAIKKYGKVWYIVYAISSELDYKLGFKTLEWYHTNYLKPKSENGTYSYQRKMKGRIVYHSMYVIEVNRSNREYVLEVGHVSGNRTKYVIKKKNAANFIIASYGDKRYVPN